MDASTGYYDSKKQTLDLRKDIFLQSSTGYEARLSQALLDMNKGTVTSEEPVDVKLLNGDAEGRQAPYHQQRRGRAVRGQCGDEPGDG